MARGAGKKDKFQDLDDDFKNSVAGMSEAAIRDKIAEVTLNQVEIEMAKKADQVLEAALEAAKIAGEGYKEAAKMNKLRVRFCRRVLSDQGKIDSLYSEESP